LALEDKELTPGVSADPEITVEIEHRLTEGKLSCAHAFAIAHELDREPLAVGWTADVLDIHLTRCQLGLFGYPGKHGWQNAGVAERERPVGLETAIGAALDAQGHLTCRSAWEVAEAFGVPRMQVGWLANELGIKIIACQLGAF
jgi:hypothetical protein